MRYRLLGRTGFSVSEIGHGLWGMGGWSGTSDQDALTALKASVAAGCNFFDTAWAYGAGKSDSLLGQLLRAAPQERLYVAAKVPPKNMKWPASPADDPEDVFPEKHVFDYVEKSREAIGIDTLDLLQFHVWDDAWTDGSWAKTVEKLKSQNLIRSFGLSLNRWQPNNGLKAIKTGLVDTVQVIYNIFDQAPEDELFPLCRELNVGVIARVPLDEGSLGGKMSLSTQFPEDDWRSRYFGPENLPPTIERVNQLKQILPKGMALPEMALRFVISNPDVSTTIVGMRQLSHVNQNLTASKSGPLGDELRRALRVHRWDREVAPWAN